MSGRHLGPSVGKIGKDSNRLDEVRGGLIQDAGRRFYAFGRSETAGAVQMLVTLTGASKRTIQYALNGGRMP